MRSGLPGGKDRLSPDGKPIMTETRTLTFYSDPDLRTIDFDIVIDPLEKLTFGLRRAAPAAHAPGTAISESTANDAAVRSRRRTGVLGWRKPVTGPPS